MVTFNHFRWAFSDGWDLVYIREVKFRFDNCALIAVNVFFIISGHVITYRFLRSGSAEILLGAAFRRVPRLVLPVLGANLISWVLASQGAFGSEQAWRTIRKEHSGALEADGNWCKNCFSTDLGGVLWSSFQVMWSFRNDHFLWTWTIPIEISGSAVIFLLAPMLRFIVNFGIPAEGSDDLVHVCGQLRPQKLLRCLMVHGLLLTVVVVVEQVMEHCSDIAGPTAGLCQTFASKAYFPLSPFLLGLASAHTRVILSAPSSGGATLVAKWASKWQFKWLPAAGLLLIGLHTIA
jgi:peptidoglycan/LPS O-acetylase OafA/YrhL